MLMGKGGRMPNNEIRKMQGMNLASLRHHVALQPLAIIMAGGIAFVCLYIGRLATKTTDVNWVKAKDMGYYNNKRFQFFNPHGYDYSNMSEKRGAPNYRE